MPLAAVPDSRRLLGIYLNDHLAGAVAGVELARRAAHGAQGTPAEQPLRALAAEIEEDRGALRRIMRQLNVPERAYKAGAGWVAEKVGRLKLNGTVVHRSPLSNLVELEGMRLGVEGKAAGWRTLRELAEHDERLDRAELDELIARARRQAQSLEELRVQAAAAIVDAGH